MSKWSRDPAAIRQDLAEAKVVHEAHPEDVRIVEYLAAKKDMRPPTEGHNA